MEIPLTFAEYSLFFPIVSPKICAQDSKNLSSNVNLFNLKESTKKYVNINLSDIEVNDNALIYPTGVKFRRRENSYKRKLSFNTYCKRHSSNIFY